MLASFADTFVPFLFDDLTPGLFKFLCQIIDFLFDILGDLLDVFFILRNSDFHLDDFPFVFNPAEKCTVPFFLQVGQGIMIAAGHDDIIGL